MTEADPTRSPIFRQRAVEAKILRHVYETLLKTEGRAVAEATIAAAVRASALEQAQDLAEEARTAGREPSMATFREIYERWSRGGALEIEVLHEGDDRLDFDVTRCRYAEMYREMGLGEIGHLLSCQRDGVFCEGYDPRIKMERAQTIMAGADRCTFRYRVEDADGA